MATRGEDVLPAATKGLVLVTLNLGEFENGELDGLSDKLIFTSERPTTLINNSQGDHVTAWALYVEFAMTIVSEAIVLAGDNDYSGITSLFKTFHRIVLKDDQLLRKVQTIDSNLNDLLNINPFILNLQQVFNARMNPLIEITYNLILAKALSKNLSLGSDKKSISFIDILENRLDVEILLKEVIAVRREYFLVIAQKIAEEYLRAQNKRQFVTFKKIPGQVADKSEGARIKNALKILRPYRGKETSSTLDQIDAKKIAKCIADLLFYEKIEYEEEIQASSSVSDKQQKISRNNDVEIFKYVLSRHLLYIFETFKELNKNEEFRKEIVHEFIKIKAKGWEGLDSRDIADKIEKSLNEPENDNGDNSKNSSTPKVDISLTVDFKDFTEILSSSQESAEVSNLDTSSSGIEFTPAKKMKASSMVSAMSPISSTYNMIDEQFNDGAQQKPWTKLLSNLKERAIKSIANMGENTSSDTQQAAGGASVSSGYTSAPSMSYLSDGLATTTRNIGNVSRQIARPLLFSTHRATEITIGLSQAITNAGRAGIINGLKQLAIPRCSLDGTMRFR